jgi:hypothetical protein
VETSRKHGPFDTRWPYWPYPRKDNSSEVPTAAPLRGAEAAEALEWESFSNRYFHERRRHDSEARSAYAAYRQGREWRRPPARLRLVPTEGVSMAVEGYGRREAGTRRLTAAMAAANHERTNGFGRDER